jgi:arsenate reductase
VLLGPCRGAQDHRIERGLGGNVVEEYTDPQQQRQGESAQVLDTRVLQRTVDHLAQHWAGVFSPDLVERVVFESYATLARTAKIRAFLAPLAGHFATDRLAALAHARNPQEGSVPQVLFVDEEDTGRSQVAAALLAHYAQGAVVARSAGFAAGEAVDLIAVQMLVERGIEPSNLYPKPVTDDVVRAADLVITFGASDGIRIYPGTAHEHWCVGGLSTASTRERAREVVADIDTRVKELWQQIHAAPASFTSTASPMAG